MSIRWVAALFTLYTEAWSTRRDTRIRLLKAQLELMKTRVPGNRVILSPTERRRLLKIGEELGYQVDDLMHIATVKTYQKWVRKKARGVVAKAVGRPRKVTASIHSLILKLAKENIG